MEVGETGAKVAAGFKAWPLKKENCRAGSLSVTVIVPEAEPVTVGENVTLMVQLAPGASVVPQEFVKPNAPVGKEDGVTAMLVKVAVVLVFVKVNVCAVLVVPTTWLEKPKNGGESTAITGVPVPERPTVAGLPVKLPLIRNVAVRLPVAPGVN
jgi:hypothetical protein